MSTETERLAPGELETVRAFVNTLDLETGVETLATPADIAVWLTTHGLADAALAPDSDGLERARALREALRALLRANATGDDPPADAVAVVNDAARAAGLVPSLEVPAASRLVASARGLDGALGHIVAVVHEEIPSGRFARLKACAEESCGWAFYDASRNHSSHWCQMGVCGNRNKSRAFRARQRGA